MSDLNKAIKLNPKNVKALKRLAFLLISNGELNEAEVYLKRCEHIEPNEALHKTHVKDVFEMIKNVDLMRSNKNKGEYKEVVENCEKVLKYITEVKQFKVIYVEALLKVCKITEAMKFIKHKLSESERNEEEFQYLYCLACYYDGQ